MSRKVYIIILMGNSIIVAFLIRFYKILILFYFISTVLFSGNEYKLEIRNIHENSSVKFFSSFD